MRAEVALLTRNVKVIGTNDQQWADEIEACPEGFDTGRIRIYSNTFILNSV